MKRFLLILSFFAVYALGVARNADSLYHIGIEEYRNGDYIAAYEKFKIAAENGHASAQYNVALCYKTGKGVNQSDSLSFYWFERSAYQGHLSAQFNTGYCYYTGRGIAKNWELAALWFNRAAEQGDAFAKKLYDKCQQAVSAQRKATKPDNVAVSIVDTAMVDEPVSNPVAVKADETEKYSQPKIPSVNIVPFEGFPFFSETELELYYTINSDSPIREFAVMLNGAKVDNDALVDTINRKISLKLPSEDCNVLLLVQNDTGWSAPCIVELKWDNSALQRPDLHVLAIGINKYDNLSELQFAVKDMSDFISAVKGKINKPYNNIDVECLFDETASKQAIEEHLEAISTKVEDNDFTFIYFAGHGRKDFRDRFYLAPVNADDMKIMSTCISQDQFNTYIDNIPGKVIVFIDACYSGSLLRSGSTFDDVVEQMNFARPGRYIYVSSSSDIVSVENRALGNGAFTKALVEAINGYATGGEPLTTVDLMEYIQKRMKELLNGTTTRPAFNGWNEPFPLFTN